MTSDAPDDVAVEPADADDADDLATLWVDLAADQRRHGSHLFPEENRAHIRETMLEHAVTGSVFVARRDGETVGFVTFGREAGRFRQDVVRGVVHNIYVGEGDRSEGIGGALLSVAEETLRERGAEAISLQAMAANDAARAFYRRHGYEPHRVELEKPTGSDTLTTDDG